MSGSPNQSVAEAMREFQERRDLEVALEGMLTSHQFEVATHQRTIVSLAEVDELAIKKRVVKEQSNGIPSWKRSARKRARAEGRRLAEEEVQRAREAALADQTARQTFLDEYWDKMIANNPLTVIAHLKHEFLDGRGNPGVLPVSCQDGRVTLVMLMTIDNDLPDALPSTTPTGTKTLKKLNGAGRAKFYQQWMLSSVLAVMRSAFAEAPGLIAVTVVVVKKGTRDPFGEQPLEVIYSGTFERERFHRIRFMEPEALDAIFYADEVTVFVKANSQVLLPLDLSQHPDLEAIISEPKTFEWLRAALLSPQDFDAGLTRKLHDQRQADRLIRYQLGL